MNVQLPLKLGRPTGVEMNALAEGARIEGNLICKGDLRLDGHAFGDVATDGRLVIGAQGVIKGGASGKNVHVYGKVEGKIDAIESIMLSATAKVVGDISAPKLVVEEGAQLSGKCTMQALRGVYASGDAHAKIA
ncbi:MAG: polymer-forming cytoskeletal protein [Sphingomonadales bacterium]|nr:polymer-forming cytoskeletal protein [Sphingomonadales bacterium]